MMAIVEVVFVILIFVLVLLQLMRNQNLGQNVSRLEQEFKDELSRQKTELNNGLASFTNSVLARMTEIATLQKNQLDTFSKQLNVLTQSNEGKMEQMRTSLEQNLHTLQQDNAAKLEAMRATVDEKLQTTLEKRLGESFKLVSDRLEMVHKGLGEMQTLAAGVGDLKKVLTNIKTRGTWGEIQLGALLEQILAKEQYAQNVVTKKGSNERVEYAIKLPGQEGIQGECVWLPIDAKFPQEDYQRLLEAQEQADLAQCENVAKQLEIRIKAEAKDIQTKYLDPPHTTDFGIMFLPTEGLYAEVIRRNGLFEFLQREHRIIITGPTTLAAVLNSLQMGFRTLAIEKRSSEVWQLLGAVKTEFGNFSILLDKTSKKLQEASNSIDTASRKSRTIQRKLKNVEELPPVVSKELLWEQEKDFEQGQE